MTELNEVLDRLTLVQSQPVGSGRVETTDTSGDETGGEAGNVSGPPRRSKKTFKLKRSHAQGEVGSFFVTGSTDAAAKPSHFYCRVCRKDISISAKGSYEILRHYQGSRHYPRDRRMRLETPGQRVLDFFGKPLDEAELVAVRDDILKTPCISWARSSPFHEDLMPDASGRVDSKLPILAKVSALIDAMKLGEAMNLSGSCGVSFS